MSFMQNLTWDEKFCCYNTSFVLWEEVNVNVSIDIYNKRTSEVDISKYIDWLQNNKEKILNEIVTKDSVQGANDWRPCSTNGNPYYELAGVKIEKEITKEIFRTSLEKSKCDMGIEIYEDKITIDMFFDTNYPDLFAGHVIHLSIDIIDDNYEVEYLGLEG